MSLNGQAEGKNELVGSVFAPKMIQGKSAYEIAIMNGKFDGTEEEWLAYLEMAQSEKIEASSRQAMSDIENAKVEMLNEIEIAAEIVQTTGNSTTAVMSQDAVSKELDAVREKKETVNLFDKDSTANKTGYIFQNTQGFTALSGYSVSHPIKAEKGTYTYHAKTSKLGANATKVIGCNAAGELQGIQIIATDNGDETATMTFDDTFTATHFLINIYNADIANVMVVKGDTMPSEYHPYTDSCVVANVEFAKSILNMGNPLYGKKITLNGDSICYGAGSTGGYGKIIAENNAMVIQNVARSGGAITAETYGSNGTTARHWICRTISKMDADADYAILEGGVNDAAINAPLGAITSGLSATLDDTTYYGAFESMLKQLIMRFPGKKVGYIAVHQMTLNYSAANDEATSYYYAAKKCCEKWGVPFLDLNIACPPFGMIYPSNTEMASLRDTYTANGDGWHPTEEGYKAYYVPKIEAWLKTL